MKNLNRMAFLAVVGLSGFAAAPAYCGGFDVDRIDPPHWWIGMNDPTLQLQVHGRDVRAADFSVDWPGVRVDSVVRLDGSPDWQHVYLTVSPDAKPGRVPLTWKEGRRKVTKHFDLRTRGPRKGAQGFSSSDVLYLIMPDRFADGNPGNNQVDAMRHKGTVDRTDPNVRHGGDLAGVRSHIDYIDSLGMTAVWFNPVLENDMEGGSYHGYATTDYYRVDPRFGTNEEYAELIDTLHGRGIKTVMDMIFNHSGSGHPWFESRPSSDWYNFSDGFRETNHKLSTVMDPYASDYDRKLMTDGWFVREMPDLNQRNPHLMKYLIQNSIWWIEEAGIDGIRQDTYAYADRDAMGRWVKAVLDEYPDFNIVGECWYADPSNDAWWQTSSRLHEEDTALPTVMDFPFMIKSRNLAPYTAETNGWQGLTDIYGHLALDYLYSDPKRVLRFLDNHDTERVITAPVDSLGSWRQAVTLLLTVPGIPQIYYGTEMLMSGTREGGDGNVRKDMPGGFPGDTTDVFDASGRTPLQQEAYDFISRLAGWRKGSKAVAEGDMKHFSPYDGIYLFRRKAGADEVIVVLNGRDEAVDADMTRFMEVAAEGKEYTDILSGEQLTLIPEGDRRRTFAPRETRVLVPAR